MKYLPVHAVPEGERFLVKLIGPMNFRMFCCVVRKLFDSLSTFARLESMMDGGSDSDDYSIYDQETEQQSDVLLNQTGNSVPLNVDGTISSGDSIRSFNGHLHSNRVVASSGLLSSPSEINELEFMGVCRDAGVVHILGNTEVLARRDSKFYKQTAVDYIYICFS